MHLTGTSQEILNLDSGMTWTQTLTLIMFSCNMEDNSIFSLCCPLKSLLLFGVSLLEASFMLKSYRVGGGVVVLAHEIFSPLPFFGFLAWVLHWDLASGLSILFRQYNSSPTSTFPTCYFGFAWMGFD